MNAEFQKELVRREIANLFNNVEQFVVKKDSMVEAIRYMYLHSSCNN